MRCPEIYSPEKIKMWDCSVEIKGKWYLAQPLGRHGIFILRRLKYSWYVLTGKCDVLKWEVEYDN